MTALYDYPPATAFGRTIPKDRFTKHRAGFRDQVARIVWAHKLAPKTLNIPAGKAVTEVQVIEMHLRVPDIDPALLRAIDREIPFPLIFELVDGPRRRVVAAHKRPSEADSAKWVTGDLLWSDWLEEEAFRAPLPTAIDMDRLYERMLGALVPEGRPDEAIEDSLARKAALEAKEREIERLESRVRREKQFNRKVTLHGELREAQAAYNYLKDK